MTIAEKAASMIGGSFARIDGPLKVSGAAMYSSDHKFPGMLYAVPVTSTIAHGTIRALDVSVAEKMPGVQAVFHRANIGKLYTIAEASFTVMLNEKRPPFADDTIRYYGQYVAAVVADTFEQAQAASAAVRVSYGAEPCDVSEKLSTDNPEVQSKRGDTEKNYAAAAVKLDETYVTPPETHNAIELHATVAVYENDAYTLYETTQGVINHQMVAAQMLGAPTQKVRIISRFLGAGFGGKMCPWPHSFIAAVASRELRRPVKLVISRKMSFQSVGHRPLTQQRMRLGATKDGRLISLRQDYLNQTSMLDDYEEKCGMATPFMYSTPNVRITSGLARRNVGTPTSMRGPGAVPGLFALESAMDELAIKLGIDPVEFRLMNEPKVDERRNLPFSSRHLTECLKIGAKKFGWPERNPKVGSMKRDDWILGWGVAACSWPALRFSTEVTLELKEDGTARAICATQDIGTGTYTAMAQLVAHGTGITLEKIDVVLGDTALPPGPPSGGSATIASVIPAVLQAVRNAIDGVLSAAVKTPNSPFARRKLDDLVFSNGFVHLKGRPPGEGVRFERLIEMSGASVISGSGKAEGGFDDPLKEKYSLYSYGAHFVEIGWQPEIARLRVNRVVTLIDGGRVINQKTGRNQIEGAIVMGVGMAMFEHTMYDPRNGAPINSNLADYLVPTHADVPSMDVTFLDYPDTVFSELGARGIGEIGLAGVAAAITNAVNHATGKRIRHLPVRIENLLTL